MIRTKKWMHYTLITLIVLTLTGCGMPSSNEPANKSTKVVKENQTQSNANLNESIKFSTKTLVENQDQITINLKIPVISGMKNENAQTKWNNQWEKAQTDLKRQMTKDAADYYEEAKVNEFTPNQYNVTSEYKVIYNKNDLLSLTTTVYTYCGGAHGSTEQTAYNIDLETGKEISLKDLFQDGKDYKKFINTIISQKIAETPDDYFSGEEGFQGVSDKQPYYIVDDGIVIYFGLYEIACYAAGIREFKIPTTQIKDYLKPEFRNKLV
ncbi:MAG: DUF3298 and DUF4163 domain-containing protein [Chitinophagales bacterium]